MKEWGHTKFLIGKNRYVEIPVYYCNRCDLFSKRLEDELLNLHFSEVGYVRLENERRYFMDRYKYFEYLFLCILKEKKREQNMTILDVGCSYGHFLEYGINKGFRVEGVEVNDILISYLRNKGYIIYRDIHEVHRKYDVICFIDSFYYFKDPLDILEKCRSLLKQDGILFFRLTNRNWIARLMNNPRILGDATHAYSIKSISKVLNKKGFCIKKIQFVESGKIMSTRKRLFYLFTYLLTLMSLKRIFFSPGLIVIAEKIK